MDLPQSEESEGIEGGEAKEGGKHSCQEGGEWAAEGWMDSGGWIGRREGGRKRLEA